MEAAIDPQVDGAAPVDLGGLSDHDLLAGGLVDQLEGNQCVARRLARMVEFCSRREADFQARRASDPHFTLTPLQETVVEVGELWGLAAGRVSADEAGMRMSRALRQALAMTAAVAVTFLLASCAPAGTAGSQATAASNSRVAPDVPIAREVGRLDVEAVKYQGQPGFVRRRPYRLQIWIVDRHPLGKDREYRGHPVLVRVLLDRLDGPLRIASRQQE